MAAWKWQRSEVGARIDAGSRTTAEDRGDGHWPLLPVAFAFLACFVLMTWPWVFGQVTIPWDAKAHFQPQIQFLADSVRRGEAPWWNPFVFSGQPQVADPQSMLFSPPMLALALIDRAPSLWAVDMTVLATMALGGIGVIVWFRDQGWHWAGALIAAIAFSFGAAMGWRLQHTGQVLSLAYWPWAMLFLERAMAQRSIGYGLLAGTVAAFIVLGRDQVALLVVYLLAARVAWLWGTAAAIGPAIRSSLAPLFAGAMAGALLVAIPVAMTVMLAADSNRPAIDFEGAGRGSLHPALLVTFVAPQLFGAAGAMADYWGPPSFAWNDTGLFIAQNVGQLYIGAVPLLLLAWGTVSGRLWHPEIRFFTIAFLVMLLYALGWYTPAFRAMYEFLPGVKLYRRPADAVFLIGALGAIMAGYVTHRLFQVPWQLPGRLHVAVIALGFVAVAGLCIVFGLRLDRLGRVPVPLGTAIGLVFAGAVVVRMAAGRVAAAPISAAAMLALFTAADIGWNNGPTTSSSLPTAHYEVMEPKTRNDTIAFLKSNVVADATRRDRIELAGLGFHWPNVSMTHRLENTLGYNPVRLGLYSRATGAEDHVGLPDQRKFSKLMPSYRSMLADMLGLRYIAAGAPIETIDKTAGAASLNLVARTRDAHIYENTSALPRVLFVTRALAADFDAIVTNGQWPEFDPRRTVLLESTSGPQPDRRPGTARILAYTNSTVVIETDSPEGGYLVLNDIWHPWWAAEVGGVPVPLLRANVLFRAVAVPASVQRVTFRFRPIQGLMHQIGKARVLH